MKKIAKPSALTLEELIIYRSEDGESGAFLAVLPEDVPDWVKDPNILGIIMDGHIAHKDGEEGWFMAERKPPWDE